MYRARRFLLSLLVVAPLASPAVAASASKQQLAPPGNAGVNQYLEDVPTAGGARPSTTVAPRAGSTSAAGSANPAVASSLKRLSGLGAEGRRAAALAAAGLPARSPGGKRSRPAAAPETSSAPNASVAIARAVGGSSGVGPLLPAILAAAAIGAGGSFALRRRRRLGP